MRTGTTRNETWALVAILLLALALRVYRLDHQSLWNDEGTSVALAQRNLVTITRNASHDIHPPLYYYLLHLWVGVFGTSEFAVRALSVLAGVGVVAGVACLGRRLFGRSVAIVAALLTAAAPFQVYYAQETRMYIWVTLFGLLSMLALLRLWGSVDRESDRADSQVEDDRAGARNAWRAPWQSLGLYLLATVAMTYTHYFGFALLVAQNMGVSLWMVTRNRPGKGWPGGRRLLLAWVSVQALIVLTYVPWLLLSWRSLTSWPGVSEPLSLTWLLGEAGRVFPLGVAVDRGELATWIGLGLSALVLPGLLLKADTDNRDATPRSGRMIAALYLLVPILTMYLLSLRRPLYNPKFVLLATPAFYLLQARGIISLSRLAGRALRWRHATALVLALLVALVCVPYAYALAGLYTDEEYFRDDYRGIAEYIEATAGPDDGIVINAPAQIETVDYYYRGSLPEYPLPRDRPIDVAETEAELRRIVARHQQLYAIYWATDESDPDGFVEGWLDEHCFKAMDTWFGKVRLVVYAVPRSAPEEIAQPENYQLGDSISLLGYTLLTPQPRSGDILQLALFWESSRAIETRYKVFAHLVDVRGNIVGQRDSEPGGGGLMTTTWLPGELVADNHGLPMQAGSPPGWHTIRVGMYSLDDGRRLQVKQDGVDRGNAIELLGLYIAPALAAPPLAALDMQSRDGVAWGDLELAGHSLHVLGREYEPELTPRAGDVLRLTLFWRKGAGSDVADAFTISLTDRLGRTVWETALLVTGGSYPPGSWEEGQVVRDVHPLHLPTDLAHGSYRLRLRVAGGDTSRRAHALRRVVIR